MTNRNTIYIAILFGLASFGLLPGAQAVIPAPAGFYPGGNTAEGQNALLSLTTGTYNTAIGVFSLLSNTGASFNTGVGAGTLLSNTANENTATGAGALLSNTTGLQNTANGAFALFRNSEGIYNTATGNAALFTNTTGESNTANGTDALFENTTGFANTAVGYGALNSNTTGSHNIALGSGAGGNLTAGDNNIDIGNNGGLGGESATIRIGGPNQTRTFITGIREVTTGIADTIPVLIDSAGQLGTASSSRRFKDQITPMDSASEAILALNPVTFHYKSDTTGKPQFGLIAEEVAQVNPNLVVRSEDGDIYTVRYEAINAMLLNEFLKERRKVEQLTKDFESKLTAQQNEIKILISGLEKVTARLEANTPTPQNIADNH